MIENYTSYPCHCVEPSLLQRLWRRFFKFNPDDCNRCAGTKRVIRFVGAPGEGYLEYPDTPEGRTSMFYMLRQW